MYLMCVMTVVIITFRVGINRGALVAVSCDAVPTTVSHNFNNNNNKKSTKYQICNKESKHKCLIFFNNSLFK